jgi:pyruvyl transferase EpsO
MDWVDENPTALGTVHEFLTTQITRYWRLKPLTRALARTFAPLAKQRLARGCRILSSGRVVITDRLHGHILSLLLGIPHVLLDNSYGKVRSFYESWTKSSDHAVWANSPREALERARSLAAAAGSYTERGFDA